MEGINNISISWLALQNLKRKPLRATLLGLCVALATAMLFAATLLLRSVETSLRVGQARLGADIVVVPMGYVSLAQEAFITGQPTSFYFDEQVEQQILALPGVQQTSVQVFVQSLSNASCCTGEFFLVGFNPLTDFTITPWLATHLIHKPFNIKSAIVGDRILLREGDVASFYGTSFNVVGILEKTGMGIDRTVYIPIEGMREMITNSDEKAEKELTITPQQISSVMVKVVPGSDVLHIAEEIEGNISNVQAFTASHLNQAVDKQLQGVLSIVLSITLVLWFMAVLTIGLVFSLIVNERQRELGLLRAMGARQQFVFRLVMAEAALLTGASGLIGIFSALVLVTSFSTLIAQKLHIPYLLPAWYYILGLASGLLALGVLAGVLASFLPALAISRLEIYAAIRRGE